MSLLTRRADREAAYVDYVTARQGYLRRIAYALCGDWAKADDLGRDTLGELRRAVRLRFGGTVIRLDYNGDGRPDLLLLAAVVRGGELRDVLGPGRHRYEKWTAETVLHRQDIFLHPQVAEQAVDAALARKLAVVVRAPLPHAHRGKVRRVQRRDLPLVHRQKGDAA